MQSTSHRLTALAFLLLLPACAPKPAKTTPPPPEAGYVVLTTQAVPLMVDLPGRTSAFETSEVRPQVSGIIKSRNFVEGSIVKAGQTLYEIDPSLYRAAQAQAQANLENAQANREAAQALADRYKPLVDIQAVSKQDYTNAVASAKQAAASVAQNQAALQTANINVAFTKVPAPISGKIGRSLYTTGALVTSGQTDALTSIQRLDPIFVDIQQSSADLVALRRSLASGGVTPSAAQAKLTLEDGSQYAQPGTVQFSEAMVDPNTGTVTLRAQFPNPSGLLLPGMYVRTRLSQATSPNAILVPQQGLTRDARGNATVMLVGPDNKALQQTVIASQTVGQSWLITSGLKAGDKVITEGLDRVKNGQPIRPVPAGSRSKPKGGAGRQPQP